MSTLPLFDMLQQTSQAITDNQNLLIAGAASLGAVVVAVRVAIERNRESLHGDASFSDTAELKAAALFEKKGIPVGMHKGRLLMHGGSRHMALAAPTRSGKGVSIITPTTVVYADSMIANDIKGELYRFTSKYREAHGHKVWKFAPFELITHGYNPLSYVSEDPMKRVSSVQEIGFILYPHIQNGSMWASNARSLFCGLALLALESETMQSTIGEVLRQSSGMGKPTRDHLQDIILERNFDEVKIKGGEGEKTKIAYVPKKAPFSGEPPLSDVCVRFLNNFINAPVETSGGILVNMQAPLQLWESETVDAATSPNSFDLRTFRDVKQTLYIVIPPSKLKLAGVLLNLLWSQAIDLNTEEMPTEKAHKIPILMVLDEFAALGYMACIENAMGHAAGYGIRFLLAFQSIGQISKPPSDGGYGEKGAKNILDNCDRVFFTPEADDSEALSKLLGDKTVKAQSVQLRNRREGSESDQRRDLMKPQELRQMGNDTAILDLKDMKRPAKVKKIIWYKHASFRNRLWLVSDTLNGVKNFTEKLLLKAEPELITVVPELDAKQWLEDKAARAKAAIPPPEQREATLSDIDDGKIPPAILAIDLPVIDTPTGSVEDDKPGMTEQELADYARAITDALGDFDEDEDDAGGIVAIEMTQVVDLETGEDITPSIDDLVDIESLDNAVAAA